MAERQYRTLTKRTVDRLAVNGKDAVFWDNELLGFGVRVYPSGKKVFVVQTRAFGRSRRVSLGTHGDTGFSVDHARKKATDVIARIKDGQPPVAPEPAPDPTVADLVRTPGSPWVFPGKKKGTRLVNLNDSWDRVRKEAGLEDVRLHDLRASCTIIAVPAALASLRRPPGRLSRARRASGASRRAEVCRNVADAGPSGTVRARAGAPSHSGGRRRRRTATLLNPGLFRRPCSGLFRSGVSSPFRIAPVVSVRFG